LGHCRPARRTVAASPRRALPVASWAMRARLEVSKHGVDNVVVAVDDWEQPPLVEGGAWMRDAAPDQVANRKVLPVGDLHVRVLVVQHGDRRACAYRRRLHAITLIQALHVTHPSMAVNPLTAM